MEKTPAQKAVETRQAHRESQNRKKAELTELREKTEKALLSILEDDRATPAEKLRASELILNMTGG